MEQIHERENSPSCLVPTTRARCTCGCITIGGGLGDAVRSWHHLSSDGHRRRDHNEPSGAGGHDSGHNEGRDYLSDGPDILAAGRSYTPLAQALIIWKDAPFGRWVHRYPRLRPRRCPSPGQEPDGPMTLEPSEIPALRVLAAPTPTLCPDR